MASGDNGASESSRSADHGRGGGSEPEETDPECASETSDDDSTERVEAPAPGVPVSPDEYRRLKSAAAEHEDAESSEEQEDGE